jgi:3,4-dihydroxy 2-butanone 4-phosphate synthase/GTP cyclohydrolase II
MKDQFNSIEEIIADVRQGKLVILVDDEDRENEGDLILAADHVSTEAINFMVTEARGLVCLTLTSQQIDRLRLPMMIREEENLSPNKTAFTVSIEASWGISTGISAADRAQTVRIASNPEAKPSDIHIPGHIFPIRAQQGGVLRRAGHTEASVDLAQLAGLNPAAVICEVMNHDGSMARVTDLKKFAQKHNIKIGTIVDLIEYRLSRDVLVEEVVNVELPPEFHGLRARVFKSKYDGVEHLVLQKGEVKKDEPVLVRMHLDCYTRDVFAQLQSGESALAHALQKIEESESGLFVLLRGMNKPAGLVAEIKALCGELGPAGMDNKDYGIGAQILRAVGATKIRLLSNKSEHESQKTEKRVGLKAFDLEIVEVVSLREDDNEKDSEEKSDAEDGQKVSDDKTKKPQNRRGHVPLQ